MTGIPIIFERYDCWFFDQPCLYPKSELEFQIEIHNEKICHGDTDYNSPFDTPYELDPVYTIPTPYGPWCELCLGAMRLRLTDPNLGHGEPRRKKNDKRIEGGEMR